MINDPPHKSTTSNLLVTLDMSHSHSYNTLCLGDGHMYSSPNIIVIEFSTNIYAKIVTTIKWACDRVDIVLELHFDHP